MRAKREPEKHPLLSRRGNRRVAAPSVCFATARILLAAAPTAPPCIRRRRRSSLLQERGCSPLTSPRRKSKPKNASRFAKRIFLCFSYLRLRRRFYLSAELHALQERNTSCEAASRRNEKKAFSAAASFFPFRQLLRGLKGASSPFLVDPARRNRWCFSGSLLARKRELNFTATAIYPAPQARDPTKHRLIVKMEVHHGRYSLYRRNPHRQP